MNNTFKDGKVGWIRYEIILMLIIIACAIYAISYESYINKNNSISITEKGAIAILHEVEAVEAFREQGRPIIHFIRNACEFVIVCNENHEMISILMLDNVEHMKQKLDSLKNWQDIFNANDEGVIDLEADGVNIEINYKWIEFESGIKHLVVYSINKTDHKLFDIFTIMQYVAITLSFIVLISLIYWRHRGIINKYKRVNEAVQEIIRK